MSTKSIGILIALILATGLVIPALAITWGEPDNGEHPHVGTLLFVQDGVGYYSCTGTMIAPRVMLTAGHCVEGASGAPNEVTYVRFEDDAMAGFMRPLSRWFKKDWLAVDAVISHPLYDDEAFPLTYEIGVVILRKPYYPKDSEGNVVFGALPERLSPPFLETLHGVDKNDFTVVGYGMQGTLKAFNQDDYEKYKGKVRLIELDSALTGSGEASAKFTNNPGTGGGVCYGDSGGPIFFKDTNTIVSVNSFLWAANGNCVGNSFHYRTDTPDAQDFIDNILSQYPD